MKRTLCLLSVFFSTFLYVGAQVCAFPDKPWKCCDATTVSECPVIGCGGDSKLNSRKNITAIPDPDTVEDWDFNDMLDVVFPASWSSGQDRALLATWGEGKAIRIKARLKKVVKYSSGKESTNCNLKKEENNDYHIVLTRVKNKPEEESITAEITPRIRPEGWTFPKLKNLAAAQTYVRVTGYLMLDTQHIGDDHPRRYTHWEIHPVTAFEVCTLTKAECDDGDGWVDLDDIPES